MAVVTGVCNDNIILSQICAVFIVDGVPVFICCRLVDQMYQSHSYISRQNRSLDFRWRTSLHLTSFHGCTWKCRTSLRRNRSRSPTIDRNECPSTISATIAFPYLYPCGEKSPLDFGDFKMCRYLLKKQTLFAYKIADAKYKWEYAEDDTHLMSRYARMVELISMPERRGTCSRDHMLPICRWWSEWVSSFLTAHQHIKGYFVPSRLLWN